MNNKHSVMDTKITKTKIFPNDMKSIFMSFGNMVGLIPNSNHGT